MRLEIFPSVYGKYRAKLKATKKAKLIAEIRNLLVPLVYQLIYTVSF